MTTDKDREVAAVHVKNELAVLAVVLVDGGLGLAEERKDAPKVAHGEVGDLVHLLVGKLLTSLKVFTNGRELVLDEVRRVLQLFPRHVVLR